jgi:transcriptional regulator with XRE-family HTH domain
MAHADRKKSPLAVRLGGGARVALTQEEVARRIGLVTEVYGRLERGLMLPSVPTLLRLCLALGVDPNTLLGLASSRPPAWLTPPPRPPASRELRLLMRTVDRLSSRQLEMLGEVSRSMAAARRPRAPRETPSHHVRGEGHGDESTPR